MQGACMQVGSFPYVSAALVNQSNMGLLNVLFIGKITAASYSLYFVLSSIFQHNALCAARYAYIYM